MEIIMVQNTSVAYEVRMRTPVGIRLGRITVTQSLGRICGFFNILNHNEPFEGTIDEDGNCCFSGKIITLVRTVHYQAIGRILPEKLILSIQDGYHTLQITGKPTESIAVIQREQ